MDTGTQATLLMHDDPHAFPDFYRDAIGFEVHADAGHGGMRGITVAPAGQPGVPMSRFWFIVRPAIPPGRCDPRLQE